MYIHISIPNYKKQSLNRLGYVSSTNAFHTKYKHICTTNSKLYWEDITQLRIWAAKEKSEAASGQELGESYIITKW